MFSATGKKGKRAKVVTKQKIGRASHRRGAEDKRTQLSLTFGPKFAGGNIWAVADRQWVHWTLELGHMQTSQGDMGKSRQKRRADVALCSPPPVCVAPRDCACEDPVQKSMILRFLHLPLKIGNL